MSDGPRSIRHKNLAYDPYFTRTDIEERCGVCGQLNAIADSVGGLSPAVELERFGGLVVSSTGTIAPLWLLAGDDLGDATTVNHPGVDGLSAKDIEYVATATTACILCGSGNFRHARGPGGNSPRQ